MSGNRKIPDESDLDEYIVPSGKMHPRRHYDRLLKKCPEHAHLRDGEAVVDFLYASEPVIRQGRMVLGEVHMPAVQGKLRGVFLWMLRQKFGRIPDFLIVLDREYWFSCDDREREILIYHEMCHCEHATDSDGDLKFDDDGFPVFCLRGHDVEEFIAVVGRYGAHNLDLKRFLSAAGAAGAGGV